MASFKKTDDLKSPTFCAGLTFASKSEFKEAVISYGYSNGKALYFAKNDNERVYVRCKQEGCPFKINLWKIKNEFSWRITTFHEGHEGCGWVYNNSMVKSTRVAKRWKKEVVHHMSWTTSEFREKVKKDEGFQLSKKQAYRALRKAKAAIEGEVLDSFNKIWDYCLEIEKTNPMTTCVVKLSELMYEEKPRFLRMYFCWEACREGYKFCRPIIGVDGTHLKHKVGGLLLTAVGVDGNDNIFPLAYAIVERETKDSWSWFLELLKKDLVLTEEAQHQMTFISDKQKGLLPAFETVIPYAAHRFCVRHFYGNMKVAGFVGKAMKDALWSAAKATTINSFKDAMTEIRNIDVEAYSWLSDKHPSEWSRSHFSTLSKCDALVNNISESFNSMILDARMQPLISCLESIRKLLMAKLFESRKKAANWKGPFCPNIMKKIAMIEKAAAGCLGTQCDDDLFEIRAAVGFGGLEEHLVNLAKWSCSCKRWELTGIPCKHDICAIWMKHGRGPVYDYIHSCYAVSNYLSIYGQSIKPLTGPSEWPKSHKEPPLPPLYTKKAGRPKKLRKKSKDELTKDGTHLNRSLLVKHCRKCNKAGHNKRRCLEVPVVRERMLYPKKRIRTKKSTTSDPAPQPNMIPDSRPLNEDCVNGEFWNEASYGASLFNEIQLPAHIGGGTQPPQVDDNTQRPPQGSNTHTPLPKGSNTEFPPKNKYGVNMYGVRCYVGVTLPTNKLPKLPLKRHEKGHQGSLE